MLRHENSLLEYVRIYMNISKEMAVNTAIKCGKDYGIKLANTRLLILYRDRTSNLLKHIEVLFRPSNFQHLTGLQLINGNGGIRENCAIEFYRRCIDRPFITAAEISFKDDGTTPMKLGALPALMDLTKITRICGDYNNRKKNLEADAIVGGVNFSLALSLYEGNREEYFPRSALLEDIRNLVVASSQVIAIFQKSIGDKTKYTKIKYVAKGINVSKINFPNEISDLISIGG